MNKKLLFVLLFTNSFLFSVVDPFDGDSKIIKRYSEASFQREQRAQDDKKGTRINKIASAWFIAQRQRFNRLHQNSIQPRQKVNFLSKELDEHWCSENASQLTRETFETWINERK